MHSRAGQTLLQANVSERVQPGVVYTTFHFPESGANVVTTDNSDWATNCPEYKVTAVQVQRENDTTMWPAAWPAARQEFEAMQQRFWQQRQPLSKKMAKS